MNSGKLPTGKVRPLEAGDIPAIAALQARVTDSTGKGGLAELEDHFAHIFLRHPWRDDAMPSLVYENPRGRLTGCMGVMPRPMIFDGEAINAAVSHTFLVEPDSRSEMAGIQLARRFIKGPQDLSLAEGNTLTRRIFEGLRGASSLLYSLRWTRPLRPSRYLLSALRRRGMPGAIALPLQPLCGLTDRILPRFVPRQFGLVPSEAAGETLEVDSFHPHWEALIQRFRLRPALDEPALRWLMSSLERRADLVLHKVLVRSREGKVIGWYIYHQDTQGLGTVIQLGGERDATRQVLDHLLQHALERGVTALTGKVEPHLFEALSDRDCLFHHVSDTWMLLHARRAAIPLAIHEGKAFLSRLDGEWWINHIYDWR